MFLQALSTDEGKIGGRRFVRIVFYFAVLIVLILYGRFNYPAVSLRMCLEHPQQYNHHVIDVGSEAVVEQVKDGGFVIRYLQHLVFVEGVASDLKVGEFVYLRARFIAPDRLSLSSVRIAKGRRSKIVFSVFPAVFIAIWFFQRFRWCRQKFHFVERKCRI